MLNYNWIYENLSGEMAGCQHYKKCWCKKTIKELGWADDQGGVPLFPGEFEHLKKLQDDGHTPNRRFTYKNGLWFIETCGGNHKQCMYREHRSMMCRLFPLQIVVDDKTGLCTLMISQECPLCYKVPEKTLKEAKVVVKMINIIGNVGDLKKFAKRMNAFYGKINNFKEIK